MADIARGLRLLDSAQPAAIAPVAGMVCRATLDLNPLGLHPSPPFTATRALGGRRRKENPAAARAAMTTADSSGLNIQTKLARDRHELNHASGTRPRIAQF